MEVQSNETAPSVRLNGPTDDSLRARSVTEILGDAKHPGCVPERDMHMY